MELIRKKLIKARLVLKLSADVGSSLKEGLMKMNKTPPGISYQNGLEALQ
jgi:hypothetical protein